MHALGTTKAARKLAVALLLVTGLIMVAFLVVFTLNRATSLHLKDLKTLVDIGGEANLPTWWNASLLFTVCVTALIAAFLPPTAAESRAGHRARRGAWLVVAAAGAYLSLDETAGLHERLAKPVRSSGIDLPTYAWLLPGVALAAVGCLVLVKAARRLPPRIARRLGVALGCYFAGAIGMEAVNGLFSDRWLDLPLLFAAGTTLEESLEMVACILAITALVDHLLDHVSFGPRPDRRPWVAGEPYVAPLAVDEAYARPVTAPRP
jgi:xanthine/uracil permease